MSGSFSGRQNQSQRLVQRMLCGAVGALSWFGAARGASAQSFCRYEISAIIQGPNCGIFGPTLVQLSGINDLGQVCGFYRDCATFDKRPFAWSEETGFVILPLPDGATNGEANDMNNVTGTDGLGQIACTLGGPGFGNGRAYLYDDGAWTLLPPSAGNTSEAYSINDARQISGDRTAASGANGFRWAHGKFADIVSPIGGIPLGLDLNENGCVAGQIFGPDTAYFWDGKVVSDLGPLLGGFFSRANAINARGIIVGAASVAPGPREDDGPTHAFIWQSNHVLDLGLPAGFTSASAIAINDAGQVLIGASSSTGSTTYLWQHGEIVKLADLVDPQPGVGFFGAGAKAINNRGQIAGIAVVDTTNAGVILTPIDHVLADVNFDCAVDQFDLLDVLRDWGPCPQRGSCLCDIVTSATFAPPGDGVVDGADLAVVLGNWTGLYSEPAANRRR